MTRIGTVIDGKYEILKEIGRGGMSIVYLAMDKHLNKQWAVKEIRKKGSGKNDEVVVNSLLAEANLMKRLDHPSLPRIVDIIDNGVTIYVVMDYIEGESLDKILAEYGAQPEETVITWAKQICDALGYLHSQKPPIIYRDMKPANVMLKPEGNIKIIDFGIAREYKEQNLADTTVLGTKGYAPPEQYSGQTDPRSDIFALGMTMHHLLTGVDPRNGEAYASVRQWNPELSEGIEMIIDKCVEPASKDRYQNCADLLYDLEHPTLITKGYKRKQKRKLAAFIASIAVCAVTLLSGFVCDLMATEVNNSEYDSLITVASSTELEQKVESYKQAIDIYPEDTRAYIKLLEAYEDAGIFNSQESAVFIAEYNANQDKFDLTSKEVAELNYKAGRMYFNYYGGVDAGNFGEKIQRARSFFETNHQSIVYFEEKILSECYYHICAFYSEYILGHSVEEAAQSDYLDLLETIESTIADMENTGAFDKLSLYNATFALLYDQCEEMADVNVDKNAVLDLFDRVYEAAKEIDPNKPQAQKLRTEILDNYDNYRDTIQRAFGDASIEETVPETTGEAEGG